MNKNSQHVNKYDGIYGLILAAGYSSRMGAFKPLLPIGDMTAFERVIDTLKKADVPEIIAITGFNGESLKPVIIESGIQSVYNEHFDEGMFTSIKAGMKKAVFKSREGIKGFLLMLVDSPLIPPGVIDQIIEKHLAEPDSFIVPCYKGKKGHPLFIPAVYTEEILSYEGEGGLKAITNRYEDKLIRLEVDEEAVVLDMDTPEGYKEILDFFNKYQDTSCRSDKSLKDLLENKRLFLVRHGEIQQHKEKIYLGQKDVPLSDKGREQASAAGYKLMDYGVDTGRIYTSDLSRTAETAEIIAKLLSISKDIKREIEVIPDTSLREMALGEWDGEYISRIKEIYPEEYKRRGENLLTFKYGHDSENFYDLQYRVMKGFRRIAEAEASEESKDIILVAHSGVIKVILSNLNNTDLSEEIKKAIPNGGIAFVNFQSA